MHLLEKPAGEFREGNEDFTNIVGKEGRARSCKREHLKSVNHWSRVPVPRRPNGIVVDWMIVGGNCLEGGCMCIRQCAAWCAKHIADFEILETLGRYQ